MRALQKLLLLPCLAPFVMLIVLSALTRGTPVRLQLLIWRTPPLPIGAWTVLAASTGAGLAASTSAEAVTPTSPSGASCS